MAYRIAQPPGIGGGNQVHSLGTHPVVGGNHRRPDVQRLPHGNRIAVV